MSFDPQPGDVYEEPSGLIVMVLKKYKKLGTKYASCCEPLQWWTCVVICDYPYETVPAGYICEYPLMHEHAEFVKLAP